MKKRFKKYRSAFENLGLLNLLRYLLHKKIRISRRLPFLLGSRYAAFSLICRPGTTDIDVFKHIYFLREYACLDDITHADLIIDCGANAGFSTAYFLTRFPHAHVVAIEPDSGNFQALQNNLRPYADRYTAIQAAVWSKSTGLTFTPFGDGREWARSVREVRPGESPEVIATDISTILSNSGFKRISILKIDIEGSEANVFAAGYESWLDRVDNIVIELHGEECTAIYRRAVDALGYRSVPFGGLTVSKLPIVSS